MMKNSKVYRIKNFNELRKLVDNTNPLKETLILVGFVRNLKRKKNTITIETKKLLFKKVPIEWTRILSE